MKTLLEIPECYKDPAYRDSRLLALGVTSYVRETKEGVLKDVRDAILEYGEGGANAERTPALAYGGRVEGVSDDDLEF